MSEHPTPWRAQHNNYDDLECVVDANGIIMALGILEEEDALKMAAAPDLLAAAKRLKELGFDDRLYSDYDDVAWEDLEKAMQKAEGERS